ncbi:MAG: hypothetical protein JWL90_3445 [Chthoniobacteraceae bacterium]|nr:hypothetical protein [Chthoniobacteraceae bacterium]
MRPPNPPAETERLLKLISYNILDTPPEAPFDRITSLAARIFSVPIALVSLIDANRQWFKSCFGVDLKETGREISFCAHTILSTKVTTVPDLTLDPRFADNPMVAGPPGVRFYAGAPLKTADGHSIGTLCLVDMKARAFSLLEEATLADLAALVVDELEFRSSQKRLQAELAEKKSIAAELEKSNKELRLALRRNSLLSTAINSTNVGVLVSDPNLPDNPAVFINPAFEKITGYKSEDVLGHNCRFMQGPGTDREIVREMREAIAARRPFNGLLLNYGKGGVSFWNELMINPVFDADGTLLHFVGLQNDVTARVNAQQALRESEARLQAILDNTTSLIYVKDTGGRYLLANRQFCTLFSPQGESAILGNTDSAFQSPQIALLLHENDRRVFATNRSLEFEETVMQLDGAHTYLSLKFPLRDSEGQPYALCGISTDITARKQTEEALHQSKARHTAILEASLDSILTIDHQGCVVEINFATETIFGYSAAQMIGKEMAMLIVPPHYREAHRNGIRRLLETGEGPVLGKRLELSAMRSDGSEFPIELTIMRIVSDGPPMFTGHMRDISARKQVEEKLQQAKAEAERANAAKSAFLSRMSHELRTPLNAILGFSQLLQRRPLDERQTESVGFIAKGGRHLLDLIDEVLDLTRIESGNTSISAESVEISDALEESLSLVQNLAESRAIRFDVNLIDMAGRFVTADRQRLKQIFVNLLSNAIKYNHDGGRVSVDCEKRLPALLCIHIHDTGRGISAEKMERLFVPFERLGAEHEGIEGHGIGLALSRQLATLMGGVIEVQSEVGRGSTFSLVLPMAANAQLSLPKEKSAFYGENGRFRTKRNVLYVEDNPANLRLMEHVASEHAGVRLITATRGGDALPLALAHRPALILLDLHLPDLGGEQVLSQLRDERLLSGTPIVIISADAMSRQAHRLLAAGANDYITKPIEVESILRLFSRYLTPAT